MEFDSKRHDIIPDRLNKANLIIRLKNKYKVTSTVASEALYEADDIYEIAEYIVRGYSPRKARQLYASKRVDEQRREAERKAYEERINAIKKPADIIELIKKDEMTEAELSSWACEFGRARG